MDDFVRREAVRKIVQYMPPQLEAVNAIPAADVRPVRHGRWILKDDGRAHCSECDTAGNSYVWHYCPHCGALMDKDGDGE